MKTKTVKTIQIKLGLIMPKFQGAQRRRLESVLVNIAFIEKAPPKVEKRLALHAEKSWSEFLEAYIGTIGTRGGMSMLHKDIEDAQKFMGRLLRETGCV